jgi:hypothetical protein
MSEKSAMFLVITGLLLTFGAVGGIENSVENSQLLTSMLVAIVGLLTMYCGVLGLRNADLY